MRLTLMLLLFVSCLIIPPNSRCQGLAQKTQEKQIVPRPAATTIEKQPGAHADQGPRGENVQTADKQYPVLVKEMPSKDIWDKVYICLTAALVVIGAVTFVGILIQAVHTKRAANASSRSITLQEAQLEQWLVAKAWSNTRVTSSHPHPVQLLIDCSIVNPTKFPLRLTGYSVSADAEPFYTQSLQYLLAPDEPFTINFPVNLSTAADSAYMSNFWFFWIHLNISFEDVLRNSRSQEFSGKLICYKGGSRFQAQSVSAESKNGDETSS